MVLVIAPAVTHALDVGDWVTKNYGRWTESLRDKNGLLLPKGVEVTGKTKTGLFSRITVNPKAARLAKGFAGGLALNLVSLAVYDMLGGAVDYVLDPANNRVTFKSKDTCDVLQSNTNKQYKGSVLDACIAEVGASLWWGTTSVLKISDTEYHCVGTGKYSTHMLASMTCSGTSEQSMTYEELAQHIKTMAENGNTEAQQGIATVVAEMLQNGELDTALQEGIDKTEQTNTCPAGSTMQNGVCVANPDPNTCPSGSTMQNGVCVQDPKKEELPAFCTWATPVCDFVAWAKSTTNQTITAVKEEYKTIKNKITDYFTEEPDKDTKLDIPDPDISRPDTDITFNGYCPDDVVIKFYAYDKNIEWTLMPWSKLCPIINTYVYYSVVSLGSFIALAIVGGRREPS